MWTLSQLEKWPFTYFIKDENENVIVSQEPYAFSSEMKIVEDLFAGVGFDGERALEAIEANKYQLKNLKLMTSAPGLAQTVDALKEIKPQIKVKMISKA